MTLSHLAIKELENQSLFLNESANSPSKKIWKSIMMADLQNFEEEVQILGR